MLNTDTNGWKPKPKLDPKMHPNVALYKNPLHPYENPSYDINLLYGSCIPHKNRFQGTPDQVNSAVPEAKNTSRMALPGSDSKRREVQCMGFRVCG